MIVVEGRRKWIGDQWLGAFQVYLDGTRTGTVMPGSHVALPAERGVHTVQVRQWWYRSKPLLVEVPADADLRLIADATRTGNLLRRMTTLIVTPSRGLTLAVRELP